MRNDNSSSVKWVLDCNSLKDDPDSRNPDTDREITFCGHTILSNEPMVVLNAEKDWRLASNPLVTGWPYIRFYAGAPVSVLSREKTHSR
jgi:GAF domain-containing protein